MTEVVRLLRQEHVNIAKLLDVLDQQINVFHAGETPDFGIVEIILDYFLSYPDLFHHPKEDLVFRKLQERDAETAKAIGDLRAEHDRLAVLTRKLAKATVDRVLDDPDMPREWFGITAKTFVDTNRSHMKMEEERFFPAALEALTAEDWREIEAQVTDREDPLFGDRAEQRYRVLRNDILGLAGGANPGP